MRVPVMSNYWLVGANWDGVAKDQSFVEQGIWMLGWNEEDQPSQYKKAEAIKIGDRVAIKKMRGQKGGLKILHIGIIKGVVLDTNKVLCTVDWVVTNLNRDIDESRGCFKSIHGPYEKNEWVQEIFCL